MEREREREGFEQSGKYKRRDKRPISHLILVRLAGTPWPFCISVSVATDTFRSNVYAGESSRHVGRAAAHAPIARRRAVIFIVEL